MSRLYGKVEGDAAKTPATRRAHRHITVWAQTEYGRITIDMSGTGEYVVWCQPVESHQAYSGGEVMAEGNINARAERMRGTLESYQPTHFSLEPETFGLGR